jgi:RHS repeat-associated protein
VVIPGPASVRATQTQPAEVLPGQGFEVAVQLANLSSVPVEGVRVREVFQGTAVPEAEKGVGRLAEGEERTVTFFQVAPAVEARGEAESAEAYQQRLAAQEDIRLLSAGEVHFTNAKGVQGQPLPLASSSRLVLPRLVPAFGGPSRVVPGQAVTYTLTASNTGAAAAASGSARVVLPDGSQVVVPLEAIAPGTRWVKELAWTVPPLPPRQQGETSSQYAARLRALNGQVRKAQVALSWQDSQGNTYGPLAQETAATLQVPNPEEVAPPLPTGSVAPFVDSVSFLYTGENPLQQGVTPGTLEARRLGVLRGKVLSRQGSAVAGVRISVLHHAEFGHTRTREDGLFDLAVNGGTLLTVQYEAEGFLPSQRHVQAPWGDFAWLPDVVLVPLDAQATPVDFSGASTSLQVVRGSPVTDADGTRQTTLLFAPGTQATALLPNGDEATLFSATVRATEYTVGEAGPASMPAELPPTVMYTYAVELSLDEALALGAEEVRFSQPVASYVDNFLGFPVGGIVPAGYYDRRLGAWKASNNGRVLQVHSIASGVARLDISGDGQPDSAEALAALGITEAEQRQLATLYAPGKSLWRVPVTHFSSWDFNWPWSLPEWARWPWNTPPGEGTPEDNPTCQEGSVIECENQALGESLPLTGTPFRLHFKSDRVPGHLGKYTLRIPVMGASVPAPLQGIVVEMSVAGRHYTYSLPAAPNQTLSFTWDGKDAYGRTVQGEVPVTGKTGYLYPIVYQRPSPAERAFAQAGTGPTTANSQRREVTLWQPWQSTVGGWNEPPESLGGWRLSIHHQLDARGQALFLGHGERRGGQATGGSITTVAGTGNTGTGFGGDGGLATQARFASPEGMAVGPDGSLYIADTGNQRIRRIRPDGVISTVAGVGTWGFGGDGGPATQAVLGYPSKVAVGPDGSLYIADTFNSRIRRVSPEGIISTVAGTATSGFGGDGGPATQALLNDPSSVAVGPDGSLYIADTNNHRIRRVGPEGIISTVAGTTVGDVRFGGDGGPATQARLAYPKDVALGPDGSLYIADTNNHRIRRVGPEGTISTVAGEGVAYGFEGDGGPATQARLHDPRGIALGPDGSLYIADLYNDRIRHVSPDGIISTVAGSGVAGFGGDGGPARQARIFMPHHVLVGPDGRLYIVDTGNNRIRAVRSSPWMTSLGEVSVPAADGSEVYVFSSGGRHLRTVAALTGALRYRFEYALAGRLTSVTDGDGQVTRVERDASGKPLALVAPHGQRTRLALDAQGYLASLTHPAGERVEVTHAPTGLLTSLRDARGGLHQYTYDAQGRLRRDTHPSGGSKQLTRTEAEDGYTVALSTALGATSYYQVQRLPGGGQKRTHTAPDGTQTLRLLAGDSLTTTTTAPDGTLTTEVLGPDARFGMQVPLLSSLQVKLPGGLTSTLTHGNSATYVNGDSSQGLSTLVDTLTLNGRTLTTTYTAATRTLTTKSAMGRLSTSTLDEKGRVVKQEVPGVLPVEYSYDAEGRPWKVTQGGRTQTHTYNTAGYLETVTDTLQRRTGFTYDEAGRPTSQQLPGGRTVGFSFDAHDNLTQLVPPGKPAHSFLYTPADATSSYAPPPPLASQVLPPTRYAYDLDGALTTTTLPDGSSLKMARDSAGRVDSLTTPRTTVDFGYDAQGRLSALTDSTGPSLAYTHDGPLLKSVTWSGGVRGRVGYSYTSDFTLGTLDVQGQSFTYGYDNDGLLTSAGALSLGRRQDNGLLSSTTLGQVKTGHQYTAYGELDTLSAAFGSTPLYTLTLVRDAAGRITSKTEVAGGLTHAWGYTYDEAGRLHTVTLDGVPHATYGYDAQGNRTRLTQGSTSLSATYDAQDRLQSYGEATYTFGPNGDLKQRRRPQEAAPTQYAYDALGALHHVQLPDGTLVDYVLDAVGRRVGKRLNGTQVQGFLYDGPLRIVAELDGSGAVASRFLYASQDHVPDYLVKGSTTYRLLTDHLGSVRLVVNASTGAVAQAIEYGPFGEVLSDSNPGFQPFGFAGGLYDSHTRLTRFGVRDYDAETGRWTDKDPLRFAGGDTNLYAYAGTDPVNFVDPTGLASAYSSYALSFGQGLLSGAVGAVAVVGIAAAASLVLPIAAVSIGLGVGSMVSAFYLGGEIWMNIQANNWNNVAYNVGSLFGGAIVGGMTMNWATFAYNGVKGPVWSWRSDWAQRYNSELGTRWEWLGTGTNTRSAAVSAAVPGAAAASGLRRWCGD